MTGGEKKLGPGISSCSSVRPLSGLLCSTFISRDTRSEQTFKYEAGDSRRTRLNTSRPCCCQSSARSSRKRLLNARRVASGEPPDGMDWQRRSGSKLLSMSGALQSSFHLAMAARLCVHALADREAFAAQDLAALLITLD